MSVQGVSSGTNPYLSNVQSGSATTSNHLKNLVNAVQSGDLKAPKTPFHKLRVFSERLKHRRQLLHCNRARTRIN